MRNTTHVANNVPKAEAIRQIVASALGDSVSKIALVEEQGNVNKAYDVTTHNGSFIVRVRFDRDEMGQFVRERYCANVIRANDDWTPEVVAIGKFETHCYSIQRKVPGIVASQYSGDMVAVWEQVGHYAARFHSIETPGYLNNMLEKHQAPSRAWCQPYFNSLGTAANSKLVSGEFLTAGEFDSAINILDTLKGLEFKPCLAHGNLSPKNIIVDPNGKAHIIDWGSCQGHMAKELDVSELLAFDTPREHVQAYLRGHGLAADYVEQNWEILNCLKLARCFTNAHWLSEIGSPRRTDLLKYVEKVRGCIQGVR